MRSASFKVFFLSRVELFVALVILVIDCVFCVCGFGICQFGGFDLVVLVILARLVMFGLV